MEKFREFKEKHNQKYFNYNQIGYWARDYIKFKKKKKYINILQIIEVLYGILF